MPSEWVNTRGGFHRRVLLPTNHVSRSLPVGHKLTEVASLCDYGDHFETPLVALSHVKPLLSCIAAHLSDRRTAPCEMRFGLQRTAEELVVYDPYYCTGAIHTRWQTLGLSKVINEDRDFYGDIACGKVPEYDVLVTNPPYSANHKADEAQILSYCAMSGRPWAVLLPTYAVTRGYYQELLQAERSTQYVNRVSSF
eukprot:778160-Amphidinium_carterae.1